MVLKTHIESFREPLKVPPVGQPKNPFFLRVQGQHDKVDLLSLYLLRAPSNARKMALSRKSPSRMSHVRQFSRN